MKTPFRAIAATIALSATVAAQYQASNRTARRVGLQVREVETTVLNQADMLTLHGPPGAAYFTLLETGGVFDRAFTYSSPQGGITEPYHVDLAGAWMLADPLLTPNLGGTIPASGTADLTFPFVVSVPVGTLLRFQAIALDVTAPGSYAVSNGVQKLVTGPVSRPNWFPPYTQQNPPAMVDDDYNDIEQADVDGDGDHDTLILSCGGDVYMFERVNNVLQPAFLLGSVPGATAIELADFDNDNWLDMVFAVNGIQGAVVVRNQGRTNNGTAVLGAWQRFTGTAMIPFDIINVPDAPTALDVETGDFNDDGYLDFVLACAGDPTTGVNNRLLINTFPTTGTITFRDDTWPSLLQQQLWPDDTEDVEIIDADLDGDLDIFFANIDGPAGRIGVDYFYENMMTPAGLVFVRRTFVANPPNDETLDLVVGDLNGDGFPDIYCGNWFFSPGNSGNFQQNTIMPDALYLTQGAALSWIDSSTLLPDNPNFVGPAASAVDPQASSDCELTDADNFTVPGWGSDEILVSAGTKCPSPLNANGLRLLNYVAAANGVPAHYNVDQFPARPGLSLIPAAVQELNINDIETGDWQGLYWSKDFGIAFEETTTTTGHMWFTR